MDLREDVIGAEQQINFPAIKAIRAIASQQVDDEVRMRRSGGECPSQRRKAYFERLFVGNYRTCPGAGAAIELDWRIDRLRLQQQRLGGRQERRPYGGERQFPALLHEKFVRQNLAETAQR